MASAAPEIPVLARDQAFEKLYRRYVKDVYHYAFALLRNPADAEDVTQTTFMNAYRAYKRGQEIEKPQNWLIKIAHNVARTRYARASRRVKEVPLEEHLDQLALPEEERPDIEGVLRALGRLPFNQRAALVMRELEGRTYAEIADTIGVSVPAVEALIFRARSSLRMRASELRALTAVPLPGSLAGLFEGGGVVAGGGALAGSGLFVKAAIALIVGAVATGVGSDRTGPANAAPETTEAVAPSLSWSASSGTVARAQVAADTRLASRSEVGRRPGTMLRGRHIGGIAPESVQAVGAASHAREEGPASSSSSSASSSASAAAPSDPVGTVTNAATPVTDVVSSVQQTATSAASNLPPVQPPSLPPPPAVELPPPPPPPSLP
jgi:RNA polymerase sigma factor (sigma-70 family)